MALSVQMPALGESVTEGTVTRWLKQEGDTVERDEPLLEVSTDKVDTEIPSPASGVLKKIVAQEDDTVEVGGELAVIDDEPSGEEQTIDEGGESGGEWAATRNPPKSREEPSRRRTRGATGARHRSRAAEAPAATSSVRRQVDVGKDARTRRVGDRRHGDSLAQEGRRHVEADEPLLEVSTDKVDTEIPSRCPGRWCRSRPRKTTRSRSAVSSRKSESQGRKQRGARGAGA